MNPATAQSPAPQAFLIRRGSARKGGIQADRRLHVATGRRRAVAAFSEQVVRGLATATLPMLARLLRGMLRRQFHLSPWQIVSAGSSEGELRIAIGERQRALGARGRQRGIAGDGGVERRRIGVERPGPHREDRAGAPERIEANEVHSLGFLIG